MPKEAPKVVKFTVNGETFERDIEDLVSKPSPGIYILPNGEKIIVPEEAQEQPEE